ncbi:MAG TPA: glycoside hydrolase family 3 N-terminal domain-containing protein [Blastocatellia bacterium]|nr:glycoside hydrolase family 3 N-terminal domain-containing protein [Blastocatellia bacterium]
MKTSLKGTAASRQLAGVMLSLCLVAALLPAFVFAQAPVYARFDRALTKKEEKWVRETLRKLTLDEKIGQMFLADASAVFMNRESDGYKQLEHHIRDNKVGGIILFRSDVWATAMLTNRFQELSKLPLLISSDLEMGMGMRLNDTPWWPPNMAVAATGEPKYARLQGEITAREARAIGINWLFAPVADVNNNPANPVINVRSYGADPQQVGEFVRAFIEGAHSAGAMTCAKHFPGHGDTATDSHIGLPVVDVSRERLDRIELVPFRAAISARVGAIMSAHISLPQIEPGQVAGLRTLSESEKEKTEFVSQTEANAPKVTKPATLSERILTGILRGELNFSGLIVSDAMNMAGISARYDAASAAVEAVKAGIDVIEKSPDIDAAILGVREAVARGEITEARINASVEKILRAKAALGLNEHRLVDLNEVDRVVSNPQDIALAQEIAERSITLVRDENRLLPLRLSQQARVLNITLADDDGAFSSQTFVAELRSRSLAVENVTCDYRLTEAELQRLLARLDQQSFTTVILSSLVRSRSGKGSVGLPPAGQRLAEELLRRNLRLVVISFGNPYLLMALPQAKTYIAAYSPFPFSQRAAARALLGEIDVTGRLPVSLPGLHERGQGLELRRPQNSR